MHEVLTVSIPGEIRQMLNRTTEEMARDLRLYAALMLFRLGKLSSGAAAEMAGIPRVMFLDLCAEYGIPVSPIGKDDLRRELSDVQVPPGLSGLINALTKMLVVSHEAKRSGVQKARNGTPLALRA